MPDAGINANSLETSGPPSVLPYWNASRYPASLANWAPPVIPNTNTLRLLSAIVVIDGAVSVVLLEPHCGDESISIGAEVLMSLNETIPPEPVKTWLKFHV